MKESLKIKHDNMALFVIRVGLGLIFIAHGYGKITGMEGTITFFSSLGLGAFWAYLVAWTEFLGGVAVILGLFSRFFSLLLAIVMVVAIFLVKINGGFGKAEIDIMLLLSSIAIMLAGPGEYTAISVIKQKQ